MMVASKPQIFVFNKKKDFFVVCSPYMKFLNYSMKKGLKNRFLNFFFNLLRVHKKMVGIFLRRKKYKDYELKNIFRYLEFPLVFKTVARLVSVNLELRYSRLRKTQIAVPTIRAPWRALRLGLSLLLKTAKDKIISAPLNRKTGLLYNLWSEIWKTYHRRSITASKSVKYVNEVISEIHNYKLSKLFPMRRDRRRIFGVKSLITRYKEGSTIDKYIHGVFRMKMLKRSKTRVYYDIFGMGIKRFFKIRLKRKRVLERKKAIFEKKRRKFEKIKNRLNFDITSSSYKKNKFNFKSSYKKKKDIKFLNRLTVEKELFRQVLKKYVKKGKRLK